MKRNIRILRIGYLSLCSLILATVVLFGGSVEAPLVSDVDNLFLTSDALSRSISQENITGEKGGGSRTELDDGSAGDRARPLGKGWKVNPFYRLHGGDTLVMAEIDGPGIINHIWMTLGADAAYRDCIFRIYWDDEKHPSVEVPAGDFFAAGWGRNRAAFIDSAVIAVLPKSGFNSFWQMPFRKKMRMTMENRGEDLLILYYQVDYSLRGVPDNAAYFHAQYRQQRPVPEAEVYTIVDGIRGKGQYVGTYLARAAFDPGWFGEGEVKFYIDGDSEYPTINGTGEEDYFLGSYGYNRQRLKPPDNPQLERKVSYTSLYAGFHVVPDPEGGREFPNRDDPERRYGQYRWHIMDPIRFSEDLRVTIQSMGIGKGRYWWREDNVSSVAYWYQMEPHAPFPDLPDREALQIPPLKRKQQAE
ncbi:MAG: glycoside hydrolase family 172 protein [Puniceicoccaceae bacterium]